MAKYESEGTWFDPAEVAKRAYPAWVKQGTGRAARLTPAYATLLDMSGVGLLKPGEYNVEWVHDECLITKKEPMKNETKVVIPYSNLPLADSSKVEITTPDGATITADAAAKAYDALRSLARMYTPVPPGSTADHYSERLDRRLGELHCMVDIHRRERDQARAQRDTAISALVERDQARADLVALKKACAFAEYMRVMGGDPASVTTPPAKPTPAVTEDTPVTLGLLRDVYEAGFQERCNTFSGRADRTPVHREILRLLATPSGERIK